MEAFIVRGAFKHIFSLYDTPRHARAYALRFPYRFPRKHFREPRRNEIYNRNKIQE